MVSLSNNTFMFQKCTQQRVLNSMRGRMKHMFLRGLRPDFEEGGHVIFELQRLVEALDDASTGLTYAALSGVRPQTVEDAERLFSPDVISFLEKKKYSYEAKYIKAVRNWRRASDERGLTDTQRKAYNMELLDLILDDLMPWHRLPE
jgi:gamma-glutamylcysteine synthetase